MTAQLGSMKEAITAAEMAGNSVATIRFHPDGTGDVVFTAGLKQQPQMSAEVGGMQQVDHQCGANCPEHGNQHVTADVVAAMERSYTSPSATLPAGHPDAALPQGVSEQAVMAAHIEAKPNEPINLKVLEQQLEAMRANGMIPEHTNPALIIGDLRTIMADKGISEVQTQNAAVGQWTGQLASQQQQPIQTGRVF